MSLYYTDPLKAAIMMRDHGVKLIDENNLPVRVDIGHTSEELIVFKDNIHGYKSWQKVDKGYVAPESLPLFQLQTFDELSDGKGHFYYVEEGEEYINQAKKLLDSGFEIFKRNGKQFYMAAGDL
jgi:hypothetical protein